MIKDHRSAKFSQFFMTVERINPKETKETSFNDSLAKRANLQVCMKRVLEKVVNESVFTVVNTERRLNCLPTQREVRKVFSDKNCSSKRIRQKNLSFGGGHPCRYSFRLKKTLKVF
jgi:hypothetical protein